MIRAYLEERYEPEDFDFDQVENSFEEGLSQLGQTMLKKDEGFLVYEMKGDALIIHDIYVKPEFRGHTKSWDLHNQVVEEAQQLGKRVAIGFSEIAGKNHSRGLKGLKVAGFEPAFKTRDQFVFIKGI